MLTKSLSSLPELSEVSVQCCQHAGIECLKQLFDFNRQCSLSQLQGASPQVVKELSQVVYHYEKLVAGFQYDLFSVDYEDDVVAADVPEPTFFVRRIAASDVPERLQAAYSPLLAELPEDIARKVASVFPDADTLVFTLARDPHVTLMVNDQWSIHDNMAFWEFCKRALEALLEAADPQSTTTVTSILRRAIDYMAENLLRREFDLLYGSLSPLQAEVVHDDFCKICASLSVRARNVVANEGMGVREVMDIVTAPDLSVFSFKNAGAHTLGEIKQKFFALFRSASEVRDKDQRWLELARISRGYPWLSAEAAEWVAARSEALGHLPLFFMTCAFFAASPDKGHRLFAMLHGINQQPVSKVEASKAFEVSQERVRQMMAAFAPDEALSRLSGECLTHYQGFVAPVVDADEALARVVDSEFAGYKGPSLSLTPTGVLQLLRMWLGGEVVRLKGHLFLLSADITANFDAKAAARALQSAFAEKRTCPRHVVVRDFIDPYVRNMVNVDYQALTSILARMAQSALGVEMIEAPAFALPQNTVVMEQEIYNILLAHGSPLGVKDIQRVLSDKFPFRNFSKIESIRSYLIKDDRIVAVGKKSVYALKEWGINSMTVRQQIYEILSQSPRPMAITEIVEALQAKGMTRNWTYVYSTIMTDKIRDYARFNGNLYGIASKSYPSDFVIEPAKD